MMIYVIIFEDGSMQQTSKDPLLMPGIAQGLDDGIISVLRHEHIDVQEYYSGDWHSLEQLDPSILES